MSAKMLFWCANMMRPVDRYRQKPGFVLKKDNSLPNGECWLTLGPSTGQATVLLAPAESAEQTAHVGKQAIGRVLIFVVHYDDSIADLELLFHPKLDRRTLLLNVTAHSFATRHPFVRSPLAQYRVVHGSRMFLGMH